MRVDLDRLRERVGNVRSDFTILVIVGIVVGLGSGLAGLGLHFALHYASATHLVDHDSTFWRYAMIALPAIGAGLSWLFLHRVLDEREHGIGELIWSASRDGGRMPKSATFSQIVGSWLTVGGGGSAGPEGPIAYSGAAIGSNIATWLGLTERRRISLLGCGVAGAISSIFNAPVTGMLFALEVVLGEWVSFNLLPIAISSVVANVLASTVLAGEPILGIEIIERFAYFDYLLALGLALVTGLGSFVLLRTIRAFSWLFRKTSRPMLWKPILGGLLVGLIGLEYRVVLGEGYGAIEATFSGLQAPLLTIGLIAIAKIVATALTLGSGGCGGIFAPSLFIGAYLGLFYHEAMRAIGVLVEPSMAHAGQYALIGMAGMLGATLQAPLTAIFLVAEITNSYVLLLPLMLVTACSAIFARHLEPAGVYVKELEEEHGSQQATNLDARILADISLEEVLIPTDTILREDQHLDDIRKDVQRSDHDLFPVADADGRHVGILRAHFLFGHDPEVRALLLVSDVMDASWPHVRNDATAEDMLPLLEDVAVLPVVDFDGRIEGFVSSRKLLLRYRQELLIRTVR